MIHVRMWAWVYQTEILVNRDVRAARLQRKQENSKRGAQHFRVIENPSSLGFPDI